ncbi:MAG: type II toxin-antitoxin system RelE/ParE family toxin, partial [Syntrophobacteraceae bacterium]
RDQITRDCSNQILWDVAEMRIDYGPGYRVYFAQSGQTLVILLAGGDKRTQSADIENALKLAREL